MRRPKQPVNSGKPGFGRYRRDPRTGKVYDAYDYGYKAWPFTAKKQ